MNKNFWRGLYVLNWLIILVFWFFSVQQLLGGDFYAGLYALGRLLGLGAVYMVLARRSALIFVIAALLPLFASAQQEDALRAAIRAEDARLRAETARAAGGGA